MNQQKLRADAHKQIEEIFKTLLPARGLSYREAQAQLSHTMLDALLDGKIALCDAGTGIGKTFSYLVAGAVFDQARCRDGCTHQPLVISTSSIALQRAVKYEYLPLLSSVLLDAGYLEDAFRPLQERISIPPEGQPFNNYAELLKIPYQVLSTVESKLLHQLSHLLRRNLQKLRSVISTLLDFEHQENLVCYAEESQGSTRLCARGEREMYFVEDSNVPIISQEMFDQAQALRKQRHRMGKVKNSKPLAGKLYCGSCGTIFRYKAVNGIHYWLCTKHDESAELCPVKPIAEDAIYAAFLRLYYNLKHYGIAILEEMLTSMQRILSRRMLWSEDVVELNKRILDLSSQNQMLTQLNQQGLIDSDIFIYQSNELAQQLQEVKVKKKRLLERDEDTTTRRTQELVEILENGPEKLDSFHAEYFHELIERIIVDSNTQIRFRMKNGLELSETIERTVR